MSKPRKFSIKLQSGEAAVVAPADDLNRVADLFEYLSKEDVYSRDEKIAWIEAAAHFRSWIEGTTVAIEGEDWED